MAVTETVDGKWYFVKGSEAEVLEYLQDNDWSGKEVRGFIHDGTDYIVLLKRGG